MQLNDSGCESEYWDFHSTVAEDPVFLVYDIALRGNWILTLQGVMASVRNAQEEFLHISTLEDEDSTLPRNIRIWLRGDAVSCHRKQEFSAIKSVCIQYLLIF